MHEPTIGALLGNVTANTELKDTNIDSRRPPKQWKDPVQICRDLFNFGKPFDLFPRSSLFPNRMTPRVSGDLVIDALSYCCILVPSPGYIFILLQVLDSESNCLDVNLSGC